MAKNNHAYSEDAQRQMAVNEWKNEHFTKWGRMRRDAAQGHLGVMEKLDLKLMVIPKGSGLVAYFENQNNNEQYRVSTLYEINGDRFGPRIEFRFGTTKNRFDKTKRMAGQPESDLSVWEELVERLGRVAGALKSGNATGNPSFLLDTLATAVEQNGSEVLQSYEQFVRDYVSNYIAPASAEPPDRELAARR